jgi:ArsR family transcriptional regulator
MPSRVSSPLAGLPPAFKALSDPTRLRILNLLSEHEVCVCFLGEVLRIVQPMVSRHLAYLKKCGLVTARREAQWTHYRWEQHPNPVVRSTMDGLRDWMLKDPTLTAERRKLKDACCR